MYIFNIIKSNTLIVLLYVSGIYVINHICSAKYRTLYIKHIEYNYVGSQSWYTVFIIIALEKYRQTGYSERPG